jgi:hypothetical protein
VTPPPPPPEPSRAGLVVGWAMIGAGVIADAIAVYEGLQAKKKGDELTRLSRMNMPVPFDPGIESAGKTANIAAIVLGIGGTALAITGAIVLITSGSSDTPESAPTAARVRLTPWVGPGMVGGGASLRF